MLVCAMAALYFCIFHTSAQFNWWLFWGFLSIKCCLKVILYYCAINKYTSGRYRMRLCVCLCFLKIQTNHLLKWKVVLHAWYNHTPTFDRHSPVKKWLYKKLRFLWLYIYYFSHNLLSINYAIIFKGLIV